MAKEINGRRLFRLIFEVNPDWPKERGRVQERALYQWHEPGNLETAWGDATRTLQGGWYGFIRVTEARPATDDEAESVTNGSGGGQGVLRNFVVRRVVEA